MSNSWLLLEHQDAALQLPEDLRHQDPFGARDCGWVEQMRPFIREFSSPGNTVLDPFCGFGTTLVAASIEGRKGIGIEIEASRVAIAQERLRRLNASHQSVLQGSVRELVPTLPPVDLVLTSVPYFGSSWTGNANPQTQVYAAQTYAEYLEQMRQTLVACKSVLRRDGFIVLMAENIRIGAHHVPLAWDMARMLSERFVMTDERMIVYRKASVQDSENDSTHTNRAHEYALIARNSARQINKEITWQYLKELATYSSQFVVIGGFAKWLLAPETSTPSDADLIVPNNVDDIAAIARWLQERGFTISRWGAPVMQSGIHAAIPNAHNLRAEQLRADGKLCLIDVWYGEYADQYRRLIKECVEIDGVQVAIEGKGYRVSPT